MERGADHRADRYGSSRMLWGEASSEKLATLFPQLFIPAVAV